MAVKKNELYSSLYASCDKLRGGMDTSQYKDYILTLLFVKYVTDKFKGVKYADIVVPEGGSFDDLIALRGNKNIGEEIDKVIAKLAEENELRGVIDNAHFNDETKLGKGQEMVDKLTGLIGIFMRPEFDFKHNKTSGDDILGDAYEYLMRKFATESGKSKGQFYTPAEVSRILAKVVGIGKIKPREEGYSVYDPACGSGSLLIRAVDEAPFEIAIYGQEKETTTAGLAKMNLVLHNKAAGEIHAADTFSSPQYFEEGSDNQVLKRFDFAVVNPPFSLKNWTDGLKDYGRFSGYGDNPPEKNADFAWLLHIIKSIKNTGKAAIVEPHGVLFRGNAEATIRQSIVDRGYIKAIIGLPTNLFYGTGIPGCIIVIDKEDADERSGIFMIDASHDFIKDGNKNRLREEDIYRIVTTFDNQIEVPGYSRMVPMEEIKVKNGYNLNIPRYIDSGAKEDIQDIEAHLHGGIPAVDVDSLGKYWNLFPGLKDRLFSIEREGYYKLNVDIDEVRNIIYNDEQFAAYADRIENAFVAWKQKVDKGLRGISSNTAVKQYIVELSEKLVKEFEDVELIDKYDVYEVLLSYWQETMADDVLIIAYDGYEAGREMVDIKEIKKKKDGTEEEKIKGWEGKIIPRPLMEQTFFKTECDEIVRLQAEMDEADSKLSELIENTADDSALSDITEDGKVKIADVQAKIDEILSHTENDEVTALLAMIDAFPMKKKEYQDYIKAHPVCKNAYNGGTTVSKKTIAGRIAEIRSQLPVKEMYREDFEELKQVVENIAISSELKSKIKTLSAELEENVKAKYPDLTDDEIKMLLVDLKWYVALKNGIDSLYVAASHSIANRVVELAERYKDTLPLLETSVADYESKVKAHLERMGFAW